MSDQESKPEENEELQQQENEEDVEGHRYNPAKTNISETDEPDVEGHRYNVGRTNPA